MLLPERTNNLAFRRMTGAALCLLPLVCGCGARSSLYVPVDEGCEPETAILQVPSTTPWFDTGIDLTAGRSLRITATGTVRYGELEEQVTGADGGHYTEQKFFPGAVLPDTVIVSLIGKVGGTAALDTGTLLPEGTPGEGPGFVGASYDELVPETGRLFLGFNDQKQAFGDNIGAFTATLTPSCE
jgi:hypothetical protein